MVTTKESAPATIQFMTDTNEFGYHSANLILIYTSNTTEDVIKVRLSEMQLREIKARLNNFIIS